MDKYYVLLLNNSYDINMYYISANSCTMIPSVIKKEVKDLSKKREILLDLDESITTEENGYTLIGSFPVIGVMKNNKMYDLITGKEIKYAPNPKDINGLSYREKGLASPVITKKLLACLGEEEIARYKAYIDEIEKRSKMVFHGYKYAEYSLLKPTTISVGNNPLLTIQFFDDTIDLITKEKIVLDKEHTITSKLSYKEKHPISYEDAASYMLYIADNGINTYIDNVRLSKVNAISRYNNYGMFGSEKKLIR